MSLLLKALKQAETAHAEKTAVAGENLKLESLDSADPAKAREWLEPPGMLFGSSGLSPAPARHARRLRMPQLSLVPATALLATLVALGYGVYLYFALQPPAAIATAPTPAPVASAPAVLAPVAPPAIVAVGPMTDVPTALESTPALDRFPASDVSVGVVAAPRPARVRAPYTATPMSRDAVAQTGTQRLPEPAAAQADRPYSFQPDSGSTLLNSAYEAYQSGQIDEAQRLYTQAAARERSVDALLGLAVIAGARNRDDDAARLYREILERDPRNAAAQAALLDLLGNTDRQAAESRLKTLIERAPSPGLYQTLGNLYAEQNRWGDAQTAYFEAYRATPNNADYAYNLAVSLDRLHQPQAALGYYEKALSLGGTHRFERAQAESRIRQIKVLP